MGANPNSSLRCYFDGSASCRREEVPNTSSQYGALIPKPRVSSWKWWRMWRSRSILPTRDRGAEVVDVVVEHVVRQVSGEEAGANARGVAFAEHDIQRAEHERSERNAHRGWHHQAQRVVGVVVVDAVDDPVHPRPDPVLGLEVEHEAVQPVLEQRPQRIPHGEQPEALRAAPTKDSSQVANPTITGTKIRIGTDGCTREKASSTRDSNIGGDARSTSVLRTAGPSPIRCSLTRLPQESLSSAAARLRVYYATACSSDGACSVSSRAGGAAPGRMSGAAGVPGFSLLMRKRITPSVI